MRRVVSLFLPSFPTDRLRRSPTPADPAPGDAALADWPRERPLATVAAGPLRVLAGVDAAARAAGLRAGMTVAQAQALVARVRLVAADPAGDAAALLRLAGWARRYSPLTAPDPPDGVWLDVTGCTHFWAGEAGDDKAGDGEAGDGEAGLLADLLGRLARREIAARAALAGTPGAAHALARFGEGRFGEGSFGAGRAIVVPAGGEAAAIAPLPPAALRLEGRTLATFARLGLDTIGALAALPRAPLARRFGALPGRRLDQAFGREEEAISPAAPEAPAEVRRSFAEPVRTTAALTRAAGLLAEELCRDLDARGLGLSRAELRYRRSDGRDGVVRIGTARASRDGAHLSRLLGMRIGEIAPGEGIESLALRGLLLAPLAPGQREGLDPAAPAPEGDLADLIDRLANRLGPGRVYRLAPRESAWPERAVRRLAPMAPPAGADWPADLPRPSRLLLPPEPVETVALLPDHPPLFFRWRRRRHAVRRADGPERICGDWWRGGAEAEAVRDYFQVEDEAGARFWLFRATHRAGDGRWFLHGFFG